MGGWKFSGSDNGADSDGGLDLWAIVLMLVLMLCLLLRYLRLLVGIWANLTFKPYPIPESPSYNPNRDVTVVIPTCFKSPSELAECIGRVVSCGPKAIFIVLLESNVEACKALTRDVPNVTVLGVPKLGKRTQMIRALHCIETSIVVWADDDVFWPDRYLENLIAIFENPNVGAGGTCQRVRRKNGSSWMPSSLMNVIGASYLERRVFNNLTTNAIDKSISTLSGRSSAYRTEILKCDRFITHFTTDNWRGKVLNSDDDKALTRWCYSNGWEIAIQRAVFLETTVEESLTLYLSQCLRWSRARFRGNFTVMRTESYWCSPKYAWGTYVIYASMFLQPSILTEGLLFYLLTLVLASRSPETRQFWLVTFSLWLLFSKLVKMTNWFLRNPLDIVYAPALIAFGLFHGLLNVYALCTLTQTAWGGKDLAALSKGNVEKDEATPLLEETQTPVQTVLTQVSNTIGDGQFFASPDDMV